ncbi:unnamed protein product [Citrullus colocynthis]|uniref:Uncharacterized protein n=1 Tax=Citrullus colocynthis TaxID=252529 RepID=A0ABP0YUU9_9ROSI
MDKNYSNWVQALATAWCFMMLLGLLCCCLSTNPRHHDDSSAANSSCTCDGGYAEPGRRRAIKQIGTKVAENSDRRKDTGAEERQVVDPVLEMGNSTVLTAHDGGVASAATFGFAVVATAVVDGGEYDGSCGGGKCDGG